jgi:hypothetical protein
MDLPHEHFNVGDFAASVWVDSQSGELGFHVSNSISGDLIVDAERLRLVVQVRTLVMPAGIRALLESTTESMLCAGVRWNASDEQLHLVDDQGRSLHCERMNSRG